jgi:translation initiation factor IF-3
MRIHRHRATRPKFNIPKFNINERIRAEEVRVIDHEGNMLGVLSTAEALAIAQEKELDLVEVSPKANPPVCKILDFGQFKYQKVKEAKKQKTQSKEVDIKGIRLTFRIGDHDRNVRLKQALKFLERGDKIKIELVLRGRERAHKMLAKEMVQEFLKDIKEVYEVRIEQDVAFQGNRVTMIVARA